MPINHLHNKIRDLKRWKDAPSVAPTLSLIHCTSEAIFHGTGSLAVSKHVSTVPRLSGNASPSESNGQIITRERDDTCL